MHRKDRCGSRHHTLDHPTGPSGPCACQFLSARCQALQGKRAAEELSGERGIWKKGKSVTGRLEMVAGAERLGAVLVGKGETGKQKQRLAAQGRLNFGLLHCYGINSGARGQGPMIAHLSHLAAEPIMLARNTLPENYKQLGTIVTELKSAKGDGGVILSHAHPVGGELLTNTLLVLTLSLLWRAGQGEDPPLPQCGAPSEFPLLTASQVPSAGGKIRFAALKGRSAVASLIKRSKVLGGAETLHKVMHLWRNICNSWWAHKHNLEPWERGMLGRWCEGGGDQSKGNGSKARQARYDPPSVPPRIVARPAGGAPEKCDAPSLSIDWAQAAKEAGYDDGLTLLPWASLVTETQLRAMRLGDQKTVTLRQHLSSAMPPLLADLRAARPDADIWPPMTLLADPRWPPFCAKARKMRDEESARLPQGGLGGGASPSRARLGEARHHSRVTQTAMRIAEVSNERRRRAVVELIVGRLRPGRLPKPKQPQRSGQPQHSGFCNQLNHLLQPTL